MNTPARAEAEKNGRSTADKSNQRKDFKNRIVCLLKQRTPFASDSAANALRRRLCHIEPISP